MQICLFLLCFLLLGALATATVSDENKETIMPSPFPVNFQMLFWTNITLDDDHDHDNFPLRGVLYYDWSKKRQRIDHGAGSYECVHFYDTQQACTMVLSPQGLYRVIHGPISGNEQRCCLDLPNLTTPPTDWALNANPTFDGIVHDKYSGQETYQWTFDKLEPPSSVTTRTKNHLTSQTLPQPQQEYHTTREVTKGENSGKPVLFSFPGMAKGRQDFHYDVNSLIIGPQDEKLFELPDDCWHVKCTNTKSQMMREYE